MSGRQVEKTPQVSMRPGTFEIDTQPRREGELTYLGPAARACLLSGPRPMIVAVEPEHRSDPAWPLCHDVGRELAKVVGIPQQALILRADAAHIRSCRVPKSPDGNAVVVVSGTACQWLVARARGPIVALGKAGNHFGWSYPGFIPTRTHAGTTYRLPDGRDLTVLPCPRGQAGWYTRTLNRELTRALLRRLLGLETECHTPQ